MNDRPESLTPEELALVSGFVDGTLDETGRRDAEALFLRSDAAREVLADTIRIHDALDGPSHGAAGEPSPTPTPGAPPRPAKTDFRWFRWRQGLGLATAASVALLVWAGLERMNPADAPASASLDAGAIVSAPAWNERPWGAVRGREPTDEERASMRAGVLWTDAEVAVAAGDSTAAADALGAIRRTVEALPLSAAAAERLRRAEASTRARGPIDELYPAGEAALCELLDCPIFRAGAGLEVARLWARFDRRTAVREDILGGLEALTLDGEASAELSRALDLLRREPPDFDGGATVLQEIIRNLAR